MSFTKGDRVTPRKGASSVWGGEHGVIEDYGPNGGYEFLVRFDNDGGIVGFDAHELMHLVNGQPVADWEWELLEATPEVQIEIEPDMIDHPAHYNFSDIEPIDAIEAWGLGYHLGTVIKYVARHEHKGKPLEDLKKARWFLDRKIAQMEMELVNA